MMPVRSLCPASASCCPAAIATLKAWPVHPLIRSTKGDALSLSPRRGMKLATSEENSSIQESCSICRTLIEFMQSSSCRQ